MSQKITRPSSNIKKIRAKNHFELCYLRHQYIRKAKTNPTEEEMRPFKAIAEHMAKNTFYTYKNLFHMIGFDIDDLISIGQIHLISFLGLFSLDKMPQKYNEFVAFHKNVKGQEPTKEQFLNKDKANCTLFLKQRMEDVVRICRNKARNIKGLPTEEYFFYCGQKKPPLIIRDLVKNYRQFGYRKLDQAVYKCIRKKIRGIEGPVFRFNNLYYVSIPVKQKSLSMLDFVGAGMDPRDSLHNMNPEERFFTIEENLIFDKNKEKFKSRSKNYRATKIRKFITENKKNPNYISEIKTARRIEKNLS